VPLAAKGRFSREDITRLHPASLIAERWFFGQSFVDVVGVGAVVESASDVLTASGDVRFNDVVGAGAVVESASDVLTASGDVRFGDVVGAGAVVESASDVLTASGIEYVLSPVAHDYIAWICDAGGVVWMGDSSDRVWVGDASEPVLAGAVALRLYVSDEFRDVSFQ